MPALRTAMAELNLANIRTFIQSGNVLFESEQTEQVLERLISDKILERFAHHVPVMIITHEQLLDVVKHNPYAAETARDDKQPYVLFADKEPDEKDVENLQAINFDEDSFVNRGKITYVFFATGAGKTKLTTAVLEKKLKIAVTARNWRTVNQLLKLTSG
jgi:uncharacterized protein (DUF1697 family)